MCWRGVKAYSYRSGGDFLDSPRRREILPPLGLLVHGRFNLKLTVEIMLGRIGQCVRRSVRLYEAQEPFPSSNRETTYRSPLLEPAVSMQSENVHTPYPCLSPQGGKEIGGIELHCPFSCAQNAYSDMFQIVIVAVKTPGARTRIHARRSSATKQVSLFSTACENNKQ
jgi:hypothetical protein